MTIDRVRANSQGVFGPRFEGGKNTQARGIRMGNNSDRKIAGAKPDLNLSVRIPRWPRDWGRVN